MYESIYVYTCIYVHVYVDVCAYVYACVYVPSAVSHLRLDCLLRSISLNTHAIFGNISNSDLINFICILLIVFSTRLLNLYKWMTINTPPFQFTSDLSETKCKGQEMEWK